MTVGNTGEQALIRRLTRRLPRDASVVAGAGDDCAVVRPADTGVEDWLLTTDPVIAGVHFAPDAPAEAVGHKAVGRVLSDIAAMGGVPRWLLIDLVLTPECPVAWVDAVYAGALALAARHGAVIVGGDTARGAAIELHVFGVGAVPRGRALLRSGAHPGDALLVTGALGGSLAGRHLRFEPRLPEGRALLDWATACMDISDGLATDLRTLMAASGAGCTLDAPSIPAAPELAALPRAQALRHALCDGEDFELLFTVPAERCADFLRFWAASGLTPACRIGTVTADAGRILLSDEHGATAPLDARGYEHFHADHD